MLAKWGSSEPGCPGTFFGGNEMGAGGGAVLRHDQRPWQGADVGGAAQRTLLRPVPLIPGDEPFVLLPVRCVRARIGRGWCEDRARREALARRPGPFPRL